MDTELRRRQRQKGAVALEYILLAALVAIGLIGAFVYFRNKAKDSVESIADTTSDAVETSTKDAEDGLSGFEASDTGGGSGGGD